MMCAWSLSQHRGWPHRSYRGRPEGGAGPAAGQGRFEGGHCLRRGAAAAASLCSVRVSDHHGVEGTARDVLSAGVLQRLQSVENYIRSVLRYVLTLQLSQLMESCVHCLLYVFSESLSLQGLMVAQTGMASGAG